VGAKEVRVMKTLALALCAVLLVAGAAPVALAQGTSTQSPPAAAPNVHPPSAAAPDSSAAKSPSTKADVDIKARTDRSGDDAGAASPRTGDVHRTGFFGLSPTAAIIVSVAVLLVVILAIVAMSHSSGTTYIDTDRRV
jgi:hypothetical protein